MTASPAGTQGDREGRKLRCHRCGSTDLVLTEVCHEIGEFMDLRVTEQGTIRATGVGYFTPGEIQTRLTQIDCQSCEHS